MGDLHFGIEITFPEGESMVEIVGYDETRFFKHLERQAEREESQQRCWQENIECGSISSYSIMGGGNKPIDESINPEDAFTYKEHFTELTQTTMSFKVSVWTLVDGELIARASTIYDGL